MDTEDTAEKTGLLGNKQSRHRSPDLVNLNRRNLYLQCA